MKKIYFVLAVLVAATLVSCEKEQSFEGMTPLKEGSTAFVIRNSSTKSSIGAPVAATGISIPVGSDNHGNSYFLEETIEELNPTPSTKGTPVYTSNVGTLYTTMGVYATGTVNGEAVFEVMDSSFGASDDSKHIPSPQDGNIQYGWRYVHSYPSGAPWPDATTPVDFYLNMPASPSGLSFTKRENQKIEFTYTSPATGAAQKDIIFGHTSINKTQHNGYLPNGAPVLMYHALTGIKFRNGHENDGQTKTIITKVEFSNLKDGGSCVVTPSTGTVTWSSLSMTLGSFYQTFENATYDATLEDPAENPDGTVGNTDDYDADHKWNSDLNGTSWTAAAADHNLNDKDGSLTFWFIPQQLTDAVELKVTFLVKTPDTPNGTSITHTIAFGTKSNNVEWKAGQLRTYTLMPKDVDVDIFDEMSGLVKSNFHVTNTGNVDEYVRVMLMGNWYGWLPDQDPTQDEPSIMVGYKTSDINDDEMVDNWFFRAAPFGNGFDNTFKMGVPANGNKWIRGTGSYYYYPEIIGAGEKLSGTDNLFISYTLDPAWVPDIWIPVGGTRQKAQGVHLVFECAVQAIGAKKPDGSGNYTWQEAWSAATGTTIGPK